MLGHCAGVTRQNTIASGVLVSVLLNHVYVIVFRKQLYVLVDRRQSLLHGPKEERFAYDENTSPLVTLIAH
jgi:hypothetical protein